MSELQDTAEDRGAWRATVRGVAKMGHNRVAKQQLSYLMLNHTADRALHPAWTARQRGSSVLSTPGLSQASSERGAAAQVTQPGSHRHGAASLLSAGFSSTPSSSHPRWLPPRRGVSQESPGGTAFSISLPTEPSPRPPHSHGGDLSPCQRQRQQLAWEAPGLRDISFMKREANQKQTHKQFQ